MSESKPLSQQERAEMQRLVRDGVFYVHPDAHDWLRRYEATVRELEASVEQLCGDVKACQQDYHDAITRVRELEQALRLFMNAVAVEKSDVEAEKKAILYAYENGRRLLSGEGAK